MGACGGKSNLSAMMVALWMDGSSDMGSIPIISIPQGTARMGGSFVLWLIYALHSLLMTLSTCNYTEVWEEGRQVLHAKMIRIK